MLVQGGEGWGVVWRCKCRYVKKKKKTRTMTPLPYANNQILFSDNMRTVSLRDSSAYCQYSTSFPQLVVLLKSKGVGEVAKIQSYYAEHFLIRL